LVMLKIYRKKRKQQKEKGISKVDTKQTRYDELSPNLEPKVNDVQLS